MDKKLYKVEFIRGTPEDGHMVKVYAFNRYEAKILAQAERIKKGIDYSVDHVWEVSKAF